ncbi:sterol desaturase family protein [uncultured Pontibacter sp.]|uniref:sterol desaturase family protein n=1 Tax=uncultured Pontibacter sp. TaxID=453356 RepID=UPI002601C795|nr:sterol desaturase family protein [uncultured Pontibacter sp.]
MEILFDQMPNPFTYFVPIFVILIAGEAYISYREDKELYSFKDSMASTWVGLGAALLNTLTKAYQIGLFFLFYKLFEPLRVEFLGYENLGWAWWVWVLCLIGDDFNFYWHHRFCHTIRIFWAAHLVHHSSDKFNLGTAFRNGWTIFLYKPIYWLWLPILGFNPVMIALCMSFNSIYQFFLHSTLVPKIPVFGQVFNTPWVHQVHHACNIEYLDRNHGGILIIWDKLFGTYLDKDKNLETKFGVLHPPTKHDPITLNFHEFNDIWKDVRSVKSWKAKFMYVFGPPGWSHDGSRKTSKMLQQEWEQQRQQQQKAAPAEQKGSVELVA